MLGERFADIFAITVILLTVILIVLILLTIIILIIIIIIIVNIMIIACPPPLSAQATLASAASICLEF